MISSALAMLLAVAAPSATAQNREGFARCLKELVSSSIEKKVDAAGFTAALTGGCRDKEAAFKAALISSDLATGIKRAASEKAASEQIADYRLMAKEDFEAAAKPANTP
jgi:hypothetical protein